MIDNNGMAEREKKMRRMMRANGRVRGLPIRKDVQVPKNASSRQSERMRWHAIADRFADATGTVRGVELGMYKGVNASNLLALMPNLNLIAIDLWRMVYDAKNDNSLYWGFSPDEWEQTYKTAKNAVAFAGDRVKILRQETDDASDIDDNLDFVFVDADHTYEGCLRDCIAWWDKIKDGGWLCGHDYGEKGEGKERFNKPGVKIAVDEFAKSVGAFVDTDADGTWFIRKGQAPIVVSFYHDTDESGDYYAKSAARLIESCERLGLKNDIRQMKRINGTGKLQGRDKWLLIAGYKRKIIADAIKAYPGQPILYVDCDCVIDRVPFVSMDHPVTLVSYSADADRSPSVSYVPKCVSAVIGFNGSKRSAEIVNQWAQAEGDDHKDLDCLVSKIKDECYMLPSSYCWRGDASTKLIYIRTNKRIREKKTRSNAKVITCAFGNVIKPLLDAHKTSIIANMPLVDHDVIEPDPPKVENDSRPAWSAPNNHKLKFWRDAVRENLGGEIILMDADTIILRDMRERFDQDKDFDLCFTDRVDAQHPINGGVVFVRCNNRTLAFFDEWCKYDDKVFNDKGYFREAQQVALGQNQASLGMLLKDKKTHECKIAFVPCLQWNNVNSHWNEFDQKECYCLHIKGGGLREHIINGGGNLRWFVDRFSELMASWNRYAPSSYVKMMQVQND
jgi:hypothetical protein